MKTNAKLVTLSQAYKYMPAAMVLAILGWIIKCMTGNAAFPKPPVPLAPAVPPDPDAPVDMTTRMNVLDDAIKNAVGGGTIKTGLKNAALASAFEGLDANWVLCPDVRTHQPAAAAHFRLSGPEHQPRAVTPGHAVHHGHRQRRLHATGRACDSRGQRAGLRGADCIGTAEWKTVKFSTQARTITLTGLTTGTVVQVRVRALGGSTGQSDWSMPGSSIVD